jgi:protein-disulfide isomerase
VTRNTWIIFTVIVVALFGGLIYLSSKDSVDVNKIDENKVIAASDSSGGVGDHVFGSSANKVVLIEYGDFQCPGCGAAYSPIKEVTEKYKDQLTFVFRNFPLTNIHPNAKAAAAAAEVAGESDKYWEMHDKLYQNQDGWKSASAGDRTDIFATYAEEIGLNKKSFVASLENNIDTLNKKINFDIALGRKAGVNSTPTFFLNGESLTFDVKDGKLIPSDDDQSTPPVWTNAEDFEKLILVPAFKEAGIDISKVK